MEDLTFLEKEECLASLELVGKGGCGESYKSELPGSEGKLISIKKKKIIPIKEGSDLSDQESRFLDKKMRQIKSEIQTVGQIISALFYPTYLPRPDCHYLIYEFMKNGSSQDTLALAVEGILELDWLARHKIPSGLEFLHLSHDQRNIHRDLKPANVLLDDNMEARITAGNMARNITKL